MIISSFHFLFFFSSRRRHTRWNCDWSSDVRSSDLVVVVAARDVVGPAVAVDHVVPGLAEKEVVAVAAVQGVVAGAAVELVTGGLGVAVAEGAVEGEIGRASCRERVWVSWVAGGLKR